MEQIKLIDVAPEVVDMQVEALPEVGPKLDVIYLVAAYRKTEDGGYWKVHRETQDHEHHESEGGGTWQRPPALERAKAQAKKLAPSLDSQDHTAGVAASGGLAAAGARGRSSRRLTKRTPMGLRMLSSWMTPNWRRSAGGCFTPRERRTSDDLATTGRARHKATPNLFSGNGPVAAKNSLALADRRGYDVGVQSDPLHVGQQRAGSRKLSLPS